LRSRLSGGATVVDAGAAVDLSWVLADLSARGVGRVLVEGGRRILTQLLTAHLADELQLVVAPLFVGDSAAPRFVDAGAFPWTAPNRARLAEVRRVGDAALLRYALTDRCPLPSEET
jgi:5-amino-6-(5-phosphoribosylamino)uracil reductase